MTLFDKIKDNEEYLKAYWNNPHFYRAIRNMESLEIVSDITLGTVFSLCKIIEEQNKKILDLMLKEPPRPIYIKKE